MAEEKYQYGMIGLGTMGRNLVYNMGDHGYSVAGFDMDIAKVEALEQEKGALKVHGAKTLEEFIGALSVPRTVMLLVPAGKAVDAVVAELKPLLSKDDLIIDCGNSHFTDTDRRIDQLKKENFRFMGIGISGGESGARRGPSIMPGGDKEIYSRVGPMLEAISAHVNNEPCVTWLGPGSAGHYVKMVHNGIEYGIMQIIAEVYHLLKSTVGLSNEELHEVFVKLNNSSVNSFLIEITVEVLAKKDELTKGQLIDMILDKAKQNGTGAWTSQDAMLQQVPIPTIDASVTARDMSSMKDERQAAEKKIHGPETKFSGNKQEIIADVEKALYFAMAVTYTQGLALLQKASAQYKYNFKLDDIAKIWRGGCIIRAAMLEDISKAYAKQSDLINLMTDDFFAKALTDSQSGMRKIVCTGVENGIPMPSLTASVSYFDTYRSGWLPANMIQGQRDFFGAHTYERTDRAGTFHTHWDQTKN